MRFFSSFSGILLLFLISLTPIGQAEDHPEASLQKAIEQTFSAGQPESLRPFLPTHGKAFASIPVAGVKAGNYSANQLIKALRQMFKRVTPHNLSINKANSTNALNGSLRATWIFTHKKNGKKYKSTLYFSIDTNASSPKIIAIRGDNP